MNQSTPIIEVKNLSKEYVISHNTQPYYTLRDSLTQLIKKPLKYFSLINNYSKKEKFLALDDINFSVMPGEVVGIIGRNGAGKSTLLKILSQITPPTKGSIHLLGRVASLLEVGTGFHPELTGRENIFLNGAILGMTQKEIRSKFDEIVEFAGIEKFLDTPVKRYSSGMYVRLAFAVAAHLEPEILVIDEVLAVGDAEFQKKCLGKMDEISKQDGRTVLFVSHNLGAINQLCKKTILLEGGQIKMSGETSKVVDEYLKKYSSLDNTSLAERKDRQGSGKLKVINYSLRNASGEIIPMFVCGQMAQIWLDYEIYDESIEEINVMIGIDSVVDQRRIAFIKNTIIGKKISVTKDKKVKIKIENLPLNIGKYQFTIYIDSFEQRLDWVQGAGVFEVGSGYFYNTGNLPPAEGQGNFLLKYDFEN